MTIRNLAKAPWTSSGDFAVGTGTNPDLGAVPVNASCPAPKCPPSFCVGAFPMKRQLLLSLVGASALLVCSASSADAFSLLGRGLGGGCCGAEPSCCAPEPSCCAPEPSCCCDPCDPCCRPRHGLLQRLRARCCRPRCCAPEPSCCAPEPSCGCAAEPSCGCDPCCDPCCKPRRHRLRNLLRRCCRPSRCCEVSCGCEPSCGCN